MIWGAHKQAEAPPPAYSTVSTILWSSLAGALILFGLFLYEDAVREQEHQEQRLATLSRLSAVGTALEGAVWRDLALVQGLTVAIGTRPDIDMSGYAVLVDGLLGQKTALSHIAAGRDLVGTFVHPLEGNMAIIGLDYRAVPEQLAVIVEVLRTRRPHLAGPVPLVQGGRGLIIRAPVEVRSPDASKGDLWGFVSGVIDYEALMQEAGLGDESLPISVAIRGRDGRGVEGDVFFGAPDLFDGNAVETEVELPSGSWRMAAVPRGGWQEGVRGTGGARLLVAGMILAVVFGAAYRTRVVREQAAAHAAVSASEMRFHSLFDSANDGILVVAPESGRIVDANVRIGAMLKTPVVRLRECPLADIEVPEERDLASAPLPERIGGAGQGLFRARLRRGDGSLLPVEISATAISDGGERVILAHVRDIGEQIAREQRLVRAQREAERANTLKSRFLANFSHEIRTPLNAIVGFSDLMRRQLFGPLKPERYAGYVDDIHKSATHLLALLNDILDLSRIEAGELPVSREWVHAASLLEDCLPILAEEARRREIDLGISSKPSGIEIRTDPVRLRQILLNLVSNALKFTPPGGRVRLALEETRGGGIDLLVDDDGPGMSDEEIADAVRPFGQVANVRAESESGSGLGLTLSRALAGLLGLELVIDSAQGRGTTVRVAVPAALMRGAGARPTAAR